MDCSTFVAQFTDYLDGCLPAPDARAMEDHLSRCGSCLRYKSVVEHGRSLLQSLPAPELREDFSTRLERRLMVASVEPTLPDEVASRAPAMAVLGIAVLLSAVAWSPMLRAPAPEVELDPIVVDHTRAPARPFAANWQNGPIRTDRDRDPLPDVDARIWEGMLLYEFSPLSRRYQESARARQVGLETGR